MTQNNALMIIDPAKSIEDARNRRSIVVTLREKNILRAGVDYGIVPGSDKPTLLKPGAERLCAAFGFNPQFEVQDKIERWDGDNPLFFYQIVCHLIHIDSGLEVATGVGSCNSMEKKYRWRWVNASDLPPSLDKSTLLSQNGVISEFTFAIDKAETSGKYGKPAAYWQSFKDAIADGTAHKTRRKAKDKEYDAWEIGGLQYRIPNDDIFSLVNTVVKMACKRALVAAALIGANASEFFTQDIEDMPGFGVVSPDTDVVEGQLVEDPRPTPSTGSPAPTPAGKNGASTEPTAEALASDEAEQVGVKTSAEPVRIGTLDMISLLNRTLKTVKAIRSKADFERVVRELQAEDGINDAMTADIALDAIQKHETVKAIRSKADFERVVRELQEEEGINDAMTADIALDAIQKHEAEEYFDHV